MTRRTWILFGLLLLVIGLLGGVGLTLLLNTPTPPVDENQPFAKGGQISQPPTASPGPTGPTEPTPLLATATPLPRPTFAAPPTSQPQPPPSQPTIELSPTPTPRPSLGLVPKKIRIPAIKLDTYVERVGITRLGAMDTPRNIWNTAWFGNGGYRPGDPGNAVIAGHLDAPGTQAVFWNLDKLKPGDQVFVSDETGKELTFQVVSREIYRPGDAPLQKIFGPSPNSLLNLITCGGNFLPASASYDKRLVVFTRLVTPS